MRIRIVHVDMDAFFASVEQLDHPEYRGKPVIVGGSSDRGVVSACSYEARAFGVHSAQSSVMARKLCPQGIFVRGRMGRYIEKSREVMAVLDRFSPVVEQASVDEAYLDGSGMERIFGTPWEYGMAMKKAVRQATGLNCSVGIAPVKFLAKIASDQNKPDGLFILEEEDVEAFVRTLPIGKIPGVGKKSLPGLEKMGIRTAGDVKKYPESFWKRRMGRMGEMLWDRAHGRGTTEVVPYHEPKSESAENTFYQDTADRNELKSWMLAQSERVGRSLRKMDRKGRTITVKIKFTDFKTITRSKSLPKPTNSTYTIYETAEAILDQVELTRAVRLIGVGVSNFGEEKGGQLSLLPDPQDQDKNQGERRKQLDKALDTIRERFGRDAMVRGKLFDFKDSKMQGEAKGDAKVEGTAVPGGGEWTEEDG